LELLSPTASPESLLSSSFALFPNPANGVLDPLVLLGSPAKETAELGAISALGLGLAKMLEFDGGAQPVDAGGPKLKDGAGEAAVSSVLAGGCPKEKAGAGAGEGEADLAVAAPKKIGTGPDFL